VDWLRRGSGTQRDERDFRRTVHANGSADGAQAWIGVERESADLVQAPDIFVGEKGQIERTEKRYSDLASVGVARKLEIDRMARNVIGIVRLVGEEHGGFAGGNAVQGGVDIGGATENIVDTGEPEAGSVAFAGRGLIGQHLDSSRLQGRGDAIGIGENVVIAEDCPKAVRGAELAQQLSARLSFRRCLGGVAHPRSGNKISGQDDHFGVQVIHQVDGGVNGMYREIRIVMKVAEQGDGETLEARGPARQGDLLAHDANPVGREQRGVGGEGSNASGRCKPDKLSPGECGKGQSVLATLAAGLCSVPVSA